MGLYLTYGRVVSSNANYIIIFIDWLKEPGKELAINKLYYLLLVGKIAVVSRFIRTFDVDIKAIESPNLLYGLISPEVEDERFDATVDKVSQFIAERGGIISEVERWGKRKLAYPIQHFMEGNYILSRIKLKPTVGKELEANLQISEEVLRHLLVKIE